MKIQFECVFVDHGFELEIAGNRLGFMSHHGFRVGGQHGRQEEQLHSAVSGFREQVR